MHQPSLLARAPSTRGKHALGRLIGRAQQHRVARWALVLAAVWLGVAGFRSLMASLAPDWSYRKDFLAIYVLARAIGEDTDPYLPVQTLADRYLGPLPGPVFPHPTPHPP